MNETMHRCVGKEQNYRYDECVKIGEPKKWRVPFGFPSKPPYPQKHQSHSEEPADPRQQLQQLVCSFAPRPQGWSTLVLLFPTGALWLVYILANSGVPINMVHFSRQLHGSFTNSGLYCIYKWSVLCTVCEHKAIVCHDVEVKQVSVISVGVMSHLQVQKQMPSAH